MLIQGNVRVTAVVAPNGRVKSIEVKGGHPTLAQAAQLAVRPRKPGKWWKSSLIGNFRRVR